MTLVEFLLARIAEDETVARSMDDDATAHDGWEAVRADTGHHRDEPVVGLAPARVLAECEAKRRIATHAQIWETTLHRTPEGWTEATATAYRMAMEWTARQLGEVYADHPDYDPEWRP